MQSSLPTAVTEFYTREVSSNRSDGILYQRVLFNRSDGILHQRGLFQPQWQNFTPESSFQPQWRHFTPERSLPTAVTEFYTREVAFNRSDRILHQRGLLQLQWRNFTPERSLSTAVTEFYTREISVNHSDGILHQRGLFKPQWWNFTPERSLSTPVMEFYTREVSSNPSQCQNFTPRYSSPPSDGTLPQKWLFQSYSLFTFESSFPTTENFTTETFLPPLVTYSHTRKFSSNSGDWNVCTCTCKNFVDIFN